MILKITANRERCTVPWYFEAAFFKGGTRPAIWVNHSVISHKAQEDARAKVVQNNYFTRIMLVSGSVILDKLTNVPWKSMVGSDVNFPVENSSFLGDIRSFRGWKKFMFPEINRKFGSKNLTVHRPTRGCHPGWVAGVKRRWLAPLRSHLTRAQDQAVRPVAWTPPSVPPKKGWRQTLLDPHRKIHGKKSGKLKCWTKTLTGRSTGKAWGNDLERFLRSLFSRVQSDSE